MQNLHRRASVARFSLCWVYWGCVHLCVHMYVWLYALAPERPNYPSCPPLLWLLNQMVPSFLAVPGHLAPQPTAAWVPEPCKWFITHTEKESTQPQPLLTSLSILLPFISLRSLNLGCQSHYFLTLCLSKREIFSRSSVLPVHFIVDVLLEFFHLISAAYPFFVSCN